MKTKFRGSERISRDDLFTRFCGVAAARWPERMQDVATMSEEEVDQRIAENERKLRAAGIEHDPIEEEFLPMLAQMEIHVRTWGELLDLGPNVFDGQRLCGIPGAPRQNAQAGALPDSAAIREDTATV